MSEIPAALVAGFLFDDIQRIAIKNNNSLIAFRDFNIF